jgi:hypothetical protein
MAATAPYREPGVDFTHAIRSIRVASALNERYRVLAQPKTYRDRDELSNVLGEARQLFPEIWSNLDDARTAPAEHGIDVAGYDALRANPATRAGGVLDVKATDNVLAPGEKRIGFGEQTVKSATMNLEGHALAIDACHAMRRALPSVDWDALDRAEDDEIAAIGSLRPPKWKLVVLVAFVIAVAVAGVVVYLYLRTAGRRA